MITNYPISSLNSLLIIVPYIWIFKKYLYKIDFFFIFVFIYSIYLIFFSLIHNYYYEDNGIFAFIDRTLVRILMCIFFIYAIKIRYIFTIYDFIGIISTIGFYLLMWYINSIDSNIIIFQGFHLCFRLCALTYLSYLLFEFYNCRNNLFQYGYVMLQIIFNFIIYLFSYTSISQLIL